MSNYRIIRTIQELPHGDETLLSIHVVSYDTEGNPDMVTRSAVAPIGNDLGDLHGEINKYKRALKKPILNMTDLKVGGE